MKKFFSFFLCLGLVGCDMTDRNQSSGQMIRHDNGLVAEAVFEYVSIEHTTSGFLFHKNAEGSRQIDSITLELRNTYDVLNTDTKIKDDVTYHFHLDVFEGGSGGTEYTLRVWKPLDGSAIALEHYVQSENEPDFTESWNLIESARMN